MRKMGWRGRRGGRTGFWSDRGTHLPGWPRWGQLSGYGRRLGYGYGRAYDPWVCQRFPWLPRWWWAQPAVQGYRTPATGYGYPRWPYPGYAAPYPGY